MCPWDLLAERPGQVDGCGNRLIRSIGPRLTTNGSNGRPSPDSRFDSFMASWSVDRLQGQKWCPRDLSLVPPDKPIDRPSWCKCGKSKGNRTQYEKVPRTSLPNIVMEVRTCLSKDWPNCQLEVEAQDEMGNSTVLIRFGIGTQSDVGMTAYMDLFVKHHEVVHKWSLQKVLRRWAVVEGKGANKVVEYALWCPWAKHTAVQQYYDIHPGLAREIKHEEQLALATYKGEITPNAVFRQLQQYLAKYHSNMISAFREMDKNCSGTLNIHEVSAGFKRLGVDMDMEQWQLVFDVIDEDKSGEIDYTELVRAIQRYAEGGWERVCKQAPIKFKMTAGERQAATYKVLHRIKEAAYSKHKKGPRKDMDLDLKSVFESMDTDKNGVVTIDELAEGLRSLGMELTKEELQLVFMHFDRDGRGCDYGEFAFTLFNRRQLVRERERWALTNMHHQRVAELESQSQQKQESSIPDGDQSHVEPSIAA